MLLELLGEAVDEVVVVQLDESVDEMSCWDNP